MISINTNLGSLIVQSNLTKSTNALNTAIERMTTGFKINGAKDNAANYSISTNMSTKISAYEVAEDNVAMGLDIVETASSSLALIEDRLARLRMLEEQAMNDTYGEESLEAINKECNALVDEINRLYYTTGFNDSNLFIDSDNDPEYQELTAGLETKLSELGLSEANFSVYDKSAGKLDDLILSSNLTIGELFGELKKYDITGSISDGIITLYSDSGNYIDGAFAAALGITLQEETYIEYSDQSSSSVLTYEETTTAGADTTFATLGISGNSEIYVRDEFQNTIGTINVSASDSIDDMFAALSAYGINGSIKNGVISLDSDNKNYAEGTLLNSLGIGVQTLSTVTVTTTATINSTISDFYSGNSYNITIVDSKTNTESVLTLNSNSTFSDFNTELKKQNMSLSINDGILTITGQDKYAKGDILDDFGVSTSPTGTYTVTMVNSMTSSTKMTYTVITTNTVTQTVTGGTFLQAVTPVDTSGLQSVSDVDLQALFDSGVTEGTFAIRTTEDMASIATQLRIIDDSDAYYTFIMANNIDYLGGEWVPIGSESYYGFSGIFDGNGFVISNVNSDIGGLFDDVSGTDSVIKNLGLENVSVTTTDEFKNVGALCNGGQGTISNCYVKGGTVSGNWGVGGLAGSKSYGSIINCYTSVTVTGLAADNPAQYAGGIIGVVGSYNDITVENCISNSKISNGYESGGIIGRFEGHELYIRDCQVSGSINNSMNDYSRIGGIVGSVGSGTLNLEIINCFVNASIRAQTGQNCISAGLVGDAYVKSFGAGSGYIYTAKIERCYVNASGTYDYGLIGEYSTDNSRYSGTVLEIEDSDCAGSRPLYDTSNTFITEDGSWSSSYKPKFNYYTSQAQITVVQTGTSAYDAASSTALSTLGINSGALTLMINGVAAQLQYSSGYTLQDFINSLATYGITASLSGGKLTIGQTNNAFITGDSGNIAQKAGLNISGSYNITTVTGYQNTPSSEISDSQISIHKQNTQSAAHSYITIKTLSTSTTLGALNLGGNYTIEANGKNVNIALKSSDTFDDFISKLKNAGIDASITGGIFSLHGDGKSGILDSALASALKLGTVNYTEGLKRYNTDSDRLTYLYELPWLDSDNIYAPGNCILQVGINSDDSSRIEIITSFELGSTEMLRRIGQEENDYLSMIDEMLARVTAKQTEFGALKNRLESALDEISIHYENLVSSRSTLRDADIAEVSSEYIQMQILQQASATLLATANQTPAIALQLL